MCAKTHAPNGNAEECRPRGHRLSRLLSSGVFLPPTDTKLSPGRLFCDNAALAYRRKYQVDFYFGGEIQTAQTVRATKLLVWVKSVRRCVRFPRSYLKMCQPNREPPRRLLIPAIRVGWSYSIRTNRWIPEVFKQIPTKSVPSDYGGGGAPSALVCSKSVQRACADAREWCRWLGCSWEQIRHWPDCPPPPLAAALSPSGSGGIRAGRAKRSPSPSLSVSLSLKGATRTLISFPLWLLSLVQFVSSSASVSKLFRTSADEGLKSLPSAVSG